jgi:phospholipid/cholesterol/gamma-HCH transport system substrate-binding protein
MTRIALKFGTFVLVCLLFTGYLAFTIGNLDVRDPLGRDTYSVSATFDDVTGLLVDDNVKVAGVVVGKVTSVRTEDGQAVVTFDLDDDHADIPKDSSAAIRWRNLIGQRYVYLYPGDSAEALEDGDEIERTASVVDLGELFNRLGPIVGSIDPAQVNEFLDTITAALDGREDMVGDALDDLATLTTGLASRDDAIQRLITNLDTVAQTVNTRDAQIETMLQNLITLSNTFGDNTATLDAALVELGSFGTELDRLLATNSAEIDRLLGNLALVTDTVHGKLPELDTALANLAEASAAVFRAGNRGEFLNQKIICAFVGPPSSNEAGCPTGDPLGPGILGQSATTGQPFRSGTTSGAAAITSLLTKAVAG